MLERIGRISEEGGNLEGLQCIVECGPMARSLGEMQNISAHPRRDIFRLFTNLSSDHEALVKLQYKRNSNQINILSSHNV